MWERMYLRMFQKIMHLQSSTKFRSEIEYYGTSSKGTHQAPDGNDYEFFYGTVTMTIKSNAQNVLDNSFSIACHQHGYMGAENVIRVIDDAQYTVMKTDISYNTYTHDAGNVAIDTNKYYVECVDKNSQVNVIDDTTHGKVLLLNNDTTYESDKIMRYTMAFTKYLDLRIITTQLLFIIRMYQTQSL